MSNWRHIALFRAMGRSKRSYLDFILLFIHAQSIPCQMIKDNLCRVTVQRKPLARAVDQLQLQRLRVSVSAPTAAASHSKQQNHRLALRAKAHTVTHNCVEKYSRVRQRGGRRRRRRRRRVPHLNTEENAKENKGTRPSLYAPPSNHWMKSTIF